MDGSALFAKNYDNHTSLHLNNIERHHHHETERYLSHFEMQILAVLSLMSALMSLLGSGSVLFCSTFHGRICVAEIFPTFHLAVSDFLSAAFLILSCIVFLVGDPSFPGSGGYCNYIMPLVTSFFTSAFLLMITYTLEALLRLRQKLSTTLPHPSIQILSSNWMSLIYLLSWVIPLSFASLVMIISKTLKDVEPTEQFEVIPMQCSLCFPVFLFNEKSCWNQVSDGSKWHEIIRLVFLTPLLLVLMINVVLYIFIGKAFKQAAMRRGLLSYHQRQEENTLKKKAVIYQGIFFFCWIPSVIVGVLSFTPDFRMHDFYWLLLIQAVFGPLQGLLNSVLYGWKRDSFRRALSETTSLLSTTRTVSMTL